jgi:hypothetical protein
MSAKLYHDLLGPPQFHEMGEEDGGIGEDGGNNGATNGGNRHLYQNSTPSTPLHHPQRDRSDSESHRAGNVLLGLSGVAMPPTRERDQSLFNLPDDLPHFQRASTTEIFDTLNVTGLGPSLVSTLFACPFSSDLSLAE